MPEKPSSPRSGKLEKIVILSLLLIAAAGFLISRSLRDSKDYGTITIEVNARPFGTYSLGKDQVIHINHTNTCEIKDGRCTMTAAACPDHVCMDMLPIDERGGLIVCLPNAVFIEASPAESEETP